MATKVISTILNLKDNMSGGLVKVAKNTKGVTKDMVSATRQVTRWKNSFTSSLTAMTSKAVKFAGVTSAAIAGMAGKIGLSEAIDLEGYRMQLETATKDTKKASDIMQYSINLANKTPFEGGELVEGAAKFEAMGMAAKKWLPLAGDMAAATNKGFDQAAEALIDAQAGELERLKEFGITKEMIVTRASQKFKNIQVVNNKGQIVNQEKFNEAMISLMKDKYTGGMEKQSTTLKGVWSTITGVTKNALANIVGMSNDGTVKAGSAMDLLKQKATDLATRLQQWQQDGTIDKLSQQFQQGLSMSIDIAKGAFDRAVQAFQFCKDHSDTLIPVIQGLVTAFAVGKVLTFVSGVITTAKTIGSVAKVVGLSTKAFSSHSLEIGKQKMLMARLELQCLRNKATIVATKALNFGKSVALTTLSIAKQSVVFAVNTTKIVAMKTAQLISTGVTTAMTAAQWALNAAFIATPIGWIVLGLVALVAAGIALYKNWDTVKAKASELWDKMKSVGAGIRDSIAGAFNSVKESARNAFDFVGEKLSALNKKIESIPIIGSIYKGIKGVGSAAINFVSDKIGKNALGTSYFRGGLTSINERGGEIVSLPNGTKIIPHDVSKRAVGRGNVSVQVYIQGNVVGNRQFADEVGETVCEKILKAIDNT